MSKPRTRIGWVDSIYVNMGFVLGPRKSIDRYFHVEATDLKEDERGWRWRAALETSRRNGNVLVLYIVKEEEHNGNVDCYASPMYRSTHDLKAPRLREMAEVCRTLSLVYSELMATDSPK